jgi:hypothetical protein
MTKTAQWTWLVYMAGDNNLEGAGRDDLLEMKKAGSTSDVNILVQFDTEQNKTTRYRIEKGKLKVLQEMPGVDCGNPKILTEFIKWGMKNYPARHYLLDVWNHGGGWENLPPDYDYSAIRLLKPKAAAKINRFRRAIFRSNIEKIHKRPPKLRAIAIDVHSQDYLDNQELRDGVFKALPKNRKLDILGCDACLMNMLEIAYEMKDTADFMVGSEETEPGEGWPYDTILKALVKKSGMSSRELAKSIASAYGRFYKNTGNVVTQSALDLGQIQKTAAAVSELADALIAGLTNPADLKNTLNGIRSAQGNSQSFEYPEYLDLGDFAGQIALELPQNAAVQATSAKILDSLNKPSGGNLVIQNSTCGDTVKYATGISIYFPSKNDYSTDYQSLAFSKDYHWKDLLETYFVKNIRLG